MAVAMDTPDPANGIHPRYKQVVARRLATAGANIAYGLQDLPTGGPLPESLRPMADGKGVEVVYDQQLDYQARNGYSGFSVGCCSPGPESCTGRWRRISPGRVHMVDRQRLKVILMGLCEYPKGLSLAYMWEDTPFKEYLGAPIYSTNGFKKVTPNLIRHQNETSDIFYVGFQELRGSPT